MRKYFKLIKNIVSLALLIVLLIVFSILKNNVSFCENWTKTFVRGYNAIWTTVLGKIPFSISEIVVFVILALSIFHLVRAIINFVHIKPVKGINHLFSIVLPILSLVSLNVLTFEFAYNRKPLDLPYYEEKVSKDDYLGIYNYFAHDLNDCIEALEFSEDGRLINRLSIQTISSLVKEAYRKSIQDKSYFDSPKTIVKPLISSFIFRELQITGITFTPFNEPNVNNLITANELPFTIAHEMAHSIGVAREDDANQVAFYVCLNSDDYYLRYSAYLYFYQISAITSPSYMSEEDRNNLIPLLEMYAKNMSYVTEYWKKHNLLSDFGDWWNDLYIKMSGIKEGSDSYQGGTEIETDPITLELIPSKYQKLFFDRYYHS